PLTLRPPTTRPRRVHVPRAGGSTRPREASRWGGVAFMCKSRSSGLLRQGHSLHLTVTQERNETRLGAMIIVCQRFREAPLLHDEKRGAIGRPPRFVWALGLPGESRGKLRLRLRNTVYLRVVLQATHDLYGTFA